MEVPLTDQKLEAILGRSGIHLRDLTEHQSSSTSKQAFLRQFIQSHNRWAVADQERYRWRKSPGRLDSACKAVLSACEFGFEVVGLQACYASPQPSWGHFEDAWGHLEAILRPSCFDCACKVIVFALRLQFDRNDGKTRCVSVASP